MRGLLLVLPLALLAGCWLPASNLEFTAPPRPGGDPCLLDEDGDGFTACGEDEIEGTTDDDCDDSNAARFPGNPEVCDEGIDNDCDDTTLETVDGDGDGETLCEGDCDDTDPDISTSAVDECDDLDTNCDGTDGTVESCDADDSDCDGVTDNDATDCPDGCDPIADDEFGSYLVCDLGIPEAQLDRTDGALLCSEAGYALVPILSEDQQLGIEAIRADFTLSFPFWIALNDLGPPPDGGDGVYEWGPDMGLDGYSNWSDGEPSGGQCVVLSPSDDFRWDASDCNTPANVLCIAP